MPDDAMSTHSSSLLRVAAVQFRSSDDLADNLARTRQSLGEAAGQGVRIAAFPECSVSSYRAGVIEQFTDAELRDTETALADMCREIDIYGVFGIPYFEDGDRYNGALVFGPEGGCVARYAKVQLAGERWCLSGKRLIVFPIDDVLATVIICHDERYPELVRLPVLAGAQLVFYISCESGVIEETKVDPYRAQIVARAEENTVFVVHANTPQVSHRNSDGTITLEGGCSHGQSRIIAPDGNLMQEASIFQEEMLVQSLDMSKAHRHIALRSVESDLLADWWRSGIDLVERQGV
jgi:predicted amidohydrolase